LRNMAFAVLQHRALGSSRTLGLIGQKTLRVFLQVFLAGASLALAALPVIPTRRVSKRN